MNVWRINLKSAAQEGIDPRKYCLGRNIVGVGWPINTTEKSVSWEEYERKATVEYYNKEDKSWWPALNALHNRMKLEDLIWTRDLQGIYYLGRISGNWYYDNSIQSRRADIVNVRDCQWQKVGIIDAVPGKIVNSFIPSRTLQAVNDDKDSCISSFSQLLFNKLSGQRIYREQKIPIGSIYSLLSSDDCEDALAIYLQQKQGYMLIPSSCKKSTMAYEYVLKHRITGKEAIVQVKNGAEDLNIDDYSGIDTDVFLFTTKGHCPGQNLSHVHVIDPIEIRDFLYNNIHLLPQKMRLWIDHTR